MMVLLFPKLELPSLDPITGTKILPISHRSAQIQHAPQILANLTADLIFSSLKIPIKFEI